MEIPIEQKIETALDAVRPLLAMHAGNVQCIRFDPVTATAYVRFEGTCRGCPLSSLTLTMGVEAMVRERVPEVQSVVDIDTSTMQQL